MAGCLHGCQPPLRLHCVQRDFHNQSASKKPHAAKFVKAYFALARLSSAPAHPGFVRSGGRLAARRGPQTLPLLPSSPLSPPGETHRHCSKRDVRRYFPSAGLVLGTRNAIFGMHDRINRRAQATENGELWRMRSESFYLRRSPSACHRSMQQVRLVLNDAFASPPVRPPLSNRFRGHGHGVPRI